MATIRTLAQLLAELPDNTSRLINPADSRDIAATAFGYVGGTDPTVNNDSVDTAGLGAFFDMGSRWYNSALNRLWICLTGIPTAAVWAQITGPAGPPGPAGPASFPPSSGMSPEDGEDSYPIPGQQGQQGIQGIQGDTGPPAPIIPGLDGEDGQEGPPVPGNQGQKGDTGERGEAGLSIPPWEGDEPEQPAFIPGPTGGQGEPGLFVPRLDGEDGEDALPIPGKDGATGATGATGQAGAAATIIPGLDGEDGEDALPGGALLPPSIASPDTASATNSGTQTLTSGAQTALTLDTETWDSNGLHSTSSATSRMTCQTPGKYTVHCACNFAASAVGIRTLFIGKNGAAMTWGQSSDTNVGTAPTILAVSALVILAAGDYVEALALQSSGGNLGVTSATLAVCRVAP